MKVIWKIIKIIVTIWMWLCGVSSLIVCTLGLYGTKELNCSAMNAFADPDPAHDIMFWADRGLERLNRKIKELKKK